MTPPTVAQWPLLEPAPFHPGLANEGTDITKGTVGLTTFLCGCRVSELPLLAEGVEKVRKLKVFETIIQNSGLRRINIATSATHTNNSCAKLDGPDFFNTLSYEQTSGRPKSTSALPPKADILVAVTDFRF